jgi:hypothetical protein
MENIKTQDYYLKNFIAKMLGLIAAREFPLCFESFVKIILNNLSNANDEEPEMIDIYLRVILSILEETDERIAIISGEILPVVLNVFKTSNENQKNREKTLKIISIIFSKLSFYDGNENDLISKILDNNDLIEECLGLFVTIISSHPKFLFDIKKFTIRVYIYYNCDNNYYCYNYLLFIICYLLFIIYYLNIKLHNLYYLFRI